MGSGRRVARALLAVAIVSTVVGVGAPAAVGVVSPSPFASWGALVSRQYVDVLGRAPTSAESSSWVSSLSSGAKSKGELVDGLRRSAENVANVDPVVRVYRAFLRRAPDAGGLVFWIGRKRNVAPARTWSVSQIAEEFTRSSEFVRKYGSLSNRQFVTQIYTDVLGRAADPSGVDYWTRQLDQKRRTRATVMVGFSESSEYKRKQAESTDVTLAYVFLLGRSPSVAEADAWVARQRAGTSHAVLLGELLESGAYGVRVAGWTVPPAPTGVTATVSGPGQVTVSWSAPAVPGAAPLTGYSVTSSTGASVSVPATDTSTTFTGLALGTSHTFSVVVVNAVGAGPPASTTVTLANVPGAPTGVSAVAGDKRATVTWSAPASNGGASLIGYVVTPYVGSVAQAPVEFATQQRTQVVRGLRSGTAYTFKVTARNASGLGSASTSSSAVTPTGITATKLAAGHDHLCALTSTGTVWCWGENGDGQLGDGTTTDRLAPVQVSGLTGATSIALGETFSCAVLTGGTVSCWGDGEQTEIDGVEDSLTPVAVPGLTGVAGLAAKSGSFGEVCALMANGQVRCWGLLQRMNGTAGVPMPSVTGATRIVAGGDHMCIVVAGGAVRCWGDNTVGQLGDGTTDNGGDRFSVPVTAIGLANVVDLAASQYTTCAVTSAGAARCWGLNNSGQLGDGTNTLRATPTAVLGGNDAVAAATSGDHTCVVRAAGAVWCSGVGRLGQLGNGGRGETFEPVRAANQRPAAALAATTSSTCALGVAGEISCWGDNGVGQLGDGNGGTDRTTPVLVEGFDDEVVSGIAASASHSCALLASGDARCWGANLFGQLGHGGTGEITEPTPVDVDGSTAISSGRGGTCVLSAGAVWCWGLYQYGQDVGPIEYWTLPTQMTGLPSPTAVAAGGSEHSCAVVSGGGVRCWGQNGFGQLGTTGSSSYTTPVAVTGLTGATGVAVGGFHTCAVLSGGSVRCWGSNLSGELGNGTTTGGATPVTATGVSGAIAVAVGSSHSCALLSGGTVKCWGYNGQGQLGDGTTTDRSTPTTVPGLTGVTAITASDLQTCALRSDGTARCWGENRYGQLGDGTKTDRSSPVAVSGLTGAVAIDAGSSHTCAVAEGRARCWGDNEAGQLGGGFRLSTTPVWVAL